MTILIIVLSVILAPIPIFIAIFLVYALWLFIGMLLAVYPATWCYLYDMRKGNDGLWSDYYVDYCYKWPLWPGEE